MESIFDKVKATVTITEVVEQIGNLHLDRNGKARCPFHQEKTPSFSVKKEENIYKCFGCGAGGDAIDFVARLKDIEPIEAAKVINECFNLGLLKEKPRYIGKTIAERKRENEKMQLENYRRWTEKLYITLCYLYRTLTDWKRDYAPKTPEDTVNNKFIFALHSIELVVFMIDELFQKSRYEISLQGYISDKELTILTQKLEEEFNEHKLLRTK